MIELVIREHLESILDVPVFFEVSATHESYVLLEKTGSSKNNYLSSSTFAFQSYGKSLFQAAQLNELVKDVVEQLVGLPQIGSVRLNSDYNFTDTATKRYRYQAVFDISHY